MESELRDPAPKHTTGAVELVRLDEVSEDATFRLREPGDVADLAAAIGRAGQLVPLELRPLPSATGNGPRWQVVAGFRRLAALHLLQRDRALARLHPQLLDEDAWAIALSEALLAEPFTVEALDALRTRIEVEGVASWALDLIDDAKARAPGAAELRERLLRLDGSSRDKEEEDPSGGETRAAEPAVVEMTPKELGSELLLLFAELNQDLDLAFDAWQELSGDTRRQILEQARYSAQLYPLLERKTR